jgi:formamidopyrimidine-DNA glycosylase
MPELPEVETVVRSLRPETVGQRIKGVDFPSKYYKVLEKISPKPFLLKIIGRKIVAIDRRAKYILIKLDQGWITFHLRMTGYLQVTKSPIAPVYTTLTIKLSSKNFLHFSDQRKFGKVTFEDNLERLNSKLGPEPLSDNYSWEELYQGLRKSSKKIKVWLLDQKNIAGIGNIYADEALWLAKLHPRKSARSIKVEQAKVLFHSIRRVLQKSIDFQGTTIINFTYGHGQSGNFQEKLNVYDQDGKACRRCRTTIIKIKLAGRGTHLCPNCQ